MATTQEITFRDAPSRMAAEDVKRGAVAPELQGQPADMEGEKVSDPKAAPVFVAGQVLKLDKTRSVRFA